MRDYDYTWKDRNDGEPAEPEKKEPIKPPSRPSNAPPRPPGNPATKEVWRERNHIYYTADVSKESIYELAKHVTKINRQFEELQGQITHVQMAPEPIYLHINSFGGGVFAAFHGIDVIKQSAIPVHTIVEGATASAGTLLSVVGAKRYIRPHASMLVHQLSSWFGGKLAEIDDEYANKQQMHETIKGIYTAHTRMAGNELDGLLRHDLWWKADKCVEQGLADALWHEPAAKSRL